MSVLDIFRKKVQQQPLTQNDNDRLSLYNLLDEYYSNNTLYEFRIGTYNNAYMESIKGLRTSVHRSVEFFASHIATDISIVSEDQLKPSIQQFLDWSDFENTKRKLIRQFALYGDIFLKIVSEEDKVYFQTINPKNVSSFDEDSKGNVIEIQIDTTVEIDEKHLTRTEKWETEYDGITMSVWYHNMGFNVDTELLGQPQEFSDYTSLGYIPIVHGKFSDFGDKYGAGCVQHALIKIDDLNRQATRLQSVLYRYNKPIWAVSSNSVDANGRPIPAPKINVGGQTGDNFDLKDDSLFYLPGNASMTPMIPNINYADALAILMSHADEIEQDLPELRYYTLKASGQISGTAIRNLLQGAIDRAEEAQNNLESSLEKVIRMGLEIGRGMGLFALNMADFVFQLDGGDVFPQDPLEMANTLQILVNSGIPLPVAMRKVGFTEIEIAEATGSQIQ